MAASAEEKRIALPDAEKLWKLLDSSPYELSSAVIHLAWRCGLSRHTIWALKWTEIDFEKAFLRLPDRDVPVEQKTLNQLRMWKSICDDYANEFVAFSLKMKKHVAEQSLNRLVRDAMACVGLESINIKDLRNDFIERALEQYDWEYAMRVCGLTASTYKAQYAGIGSRKRPVGPQVGKEPNDPARIRQTLEKNKESTAGLALWLAFDADLRVHEIASLTWPQVDFAKQTVRTQRGEIAISDRLTELLEREKASRSPDEPPYVVLSPRSKKPMDKARMSVVMKDLLLKSGVSTTDVTALKSGVAREPQKQAILDYVRGNGSITGAAAEALLGTSREGALRVLKSLTDGGKLAKTRKGGWIPAEEAVPEERWRSAVAALANEQGRVTKAEVAKLLHTGNYSAQALLKSMKQEGTLRQVYGTGAFEPAVKGGEDRA